MESHSEIRTLITECLTKCQFSQLLITDDNYSHTAVIWQWWWTRHILWSNTWGLFQQSRF